MVTQNQLNRNPIVKSIRGFNLATPGQKQIHQLNKNFIIPNSPVPIKTY